MLFYYILFFKFSLNAFFTQKHFVRKITKIFLTIYLLFIYLFTFIAKALLRDFDFFHLIIMFIVAKSFYKLVQYRLKLSDACLVNLIEIHL